MGILMITIGIGILMISTIELILVLKKWREEKRWKN